MTPNPQRNSWARTASPRPDSAGPRETPVIPEVDWQLRQLTAVDGDDLFRDARGNVLIRILAFFAKRKMPALVCGVLLLAAAGRFLSAPAGSTVGGLPVDVVTTALAAVAILIALLVTLGAWLRPVESVDDAVAVMTVPLIALEKGAQVDVH